MQKLLSLVLLCLGVAAPAPVQELDLPPAAVRDEATLAQAMPGLARQVMANYKEEDREKYLDNLFRLQMLAGQYAEANATLRSLRDILKAKDPTYGDVANAQFEMYANAKLKQAAANLPFADAFRQSFRDAFAQLDDKHAFRVAGYFIFDLPRARSDLQSALDRQKDKPGIDVANAIALASKYQWYQIYQEILPLAQTLVAEDDNRRYVIQEDVLIKTQEGATLSAAVVRKKGLAGPQPAALFFNIYANLGLGQAKRAAAYGYVGVAADTRGKRLSPDEVVPYEHEAKDTYAVIDWISRQPWSNGKVGMWGGSYSGFAAWAATKRLHPALKTIVPYVAAIPGLGLPMENNVFLNANYGWAFYVTDNKYLDDKVYFDPQRWDSLRNNWYASGRSYRDIDKVDGTPNRFLQRWLQHPSYDKYWQDMVPYQEDFARINIPVLSITGYYDDGQISALQYLKEHYKHNQRADHYLLIGPYDHFGAQSSRKAPVLNGYAIDPVAMIDTPEITFQWMDYVLRGGEKPALLKDKINYQVMG